MKSDLRDVKCLTVDDVSSMRRVYRGHVAMQEALDRGDVAVAALRADWRKYFDFWQPFLYQSEPFEKRRDDWLESHNLALTQAEALGIFEEGEHMTDNEKPRSRLNEQQEARMRERIEAGEPMSVDDWEYIFAVDSKSKPDEAE